MFVTESATKARVQLSVDRPRRESVRIHALRWENNACEVVIKEMLVDGVEIRVVVHYWLTNWGGGRERSVGEKPHAQVASVSLLRLPAHPKGPTN